MRIVWHPQGKGGPIPKGGLPANTPVLDYTSESLDVIVSGDDLTISRSPLGTFVTAVLKRSDIVVGGQGITTFGVLIPEVNVQNMHTVPINTIGVLSVRRGASIPGHGQLQTYTEMGLIGTAADVVLPL